MTTTTAAVVGSTAAATAATPEAVYPNPLIPGFYPDPSVLKVGTDYYIANSTFEYLPGVPVFHSTDLVTWSLVGHVVERPGQLDSTDIPTNGGAWAPTIRYREGTFYVVITDAMGRGMLIFTASDPAGPWSDGTVIDGIHGIDPDLAWDENGVAHITYSGLDTTSDERMTGGHKGILQFTVDLETGKPLSEPISLWSGTGLKFPEAPHIYFHDGYWYLMIAEGGTERGHGISVARGPSASGPFESGPANPVVSARSTARPIQNTGHGDLVETPDGGWAVVMLGMRPTGGTQAFAALGRETFITPARWVDGWLQIDPVILAPRSGDAAFVDDFDGDKLLPDWIAIRRYPAEVSTLADGRLVLHGDGSTLDDQHPVFLGYRQQHQQMESCVIVDVGEDGRGGLSVRFDELHHYEIEVGDGNVTARASVATIRQEWTVPAPAGPVTLHLDCVPPRVESFLDMFTCDMVVLSYSTEGSAKTEVARIDGRYLSQETAASFTGRVLGLYAVIGNVSFAHFSYNGREA